jgi:uncharacterized protein (TIGR02996 family)
MMAKKPTAKARQQPSASTYPVNPALEAAVIANAEDDTPRLVYADWLDENGDPDRAAFIRTQVALWDKHPADPDYVDLIERQEELDLLGVADRLKPQLPPELDFCLSPPSPSIFFTGDYRDGFARGFPFFAEQRPAAPGTRPRRRERAVRLCKKLPALFRSTTIRGLRCDNHLDSPEIGKLAALCVRERDTDSSVRNILNSAKNLQWLWAGDALVAVADLIAGVKSVTPLKRFAGEFDYCSGEYLEKLFASDWFRGLHRVQVSFPEWMGAPIAKALAGLSQLHTLESSTFHRDAIAVLPDVGPFRSLGRFRISAWLHAEEAKALAKARMPRLSVLELDMCEMTDKEIITLARSPLFANLRLLALDNPIGDEGITAIAESDSARQLRYLNLQDNARGSTFGKEWLRRLTTSFPKLTTLRVGGNRPVSVTPPEVTRFFAETSSPFRSLSLPIAIPDDAALEIAKNAAFSQLGTLNTAAVHYGVQPLTDEGLKTLLGAQNLSNLTYLTVGGVDLQKVIPLLRDPRVLPKLRELRIGVSPKVGAKVVRPRADLTVHCIPGT